MEDSIAVWRVVFDAETLDAANSGGLREAQPKP